MTLSAFCAFALLARLTRRLLWLALGLALLALAYWKAPVQKDEHEY